MICDPTGKSQSSQEDCELLVATAGYETRSREAEKEMEGRDDRQAHRAKARHLLEEQNQVVKRYVKHDLSVFLQAVQRSRVRGGVIKSGHHGSLDRITSTGVKLYFNKQEDVLYPH